jgi:hypothetical protein
LGENLKISRHYYNSYLDLILHFGFTLVSKMKKVAQRKMKKKISKIKFPFCVVADAKKALFCKRDKKNPRISDLTQQIFS